MSKVGLYVAIGFIVLVAGLIVAGEVWFDLHVPIGLRR